MTKDEAIHKVVSLAYEEVGYREGPNNYNKYAADPIMTQAYGWSLQNQPWCAVFVNWLFLTSFGLDLGKKMTYGCSPGCAAQASYYQNGGAYFHEPEKGDQIFFYYDGGINHTGIVVDVTGATITTIEGNYSDSVCRNTYYINDGKIAGYGRPNWDLVADVPDEGDGDPVDYGERECPILKYGSGLNNPMPEVKAWQNLLLAWHFGVGNAGADGEFGRATETATKQWQSSLGFVADGIAHEDQWAEIIQIPV